MPQATAVYINPPKYKSQLIVVWQDAKDIMKGIQKAEYNSRGTARQLARAFNCSDQKLVAARVWYWLRKNIKYKAEPRHGQTVKEISRFVADGIGDCKHYSTFAVGVLNACGIPAWFSYAGQDPSKRKPNHAYCTALIDGQLVYIDPCRRRFNTECRYFYKWDQSPISKRP